MTTAFKVYKEYLKMKLHFQAKVHYTQGNRANLESLANRNDAKFFGYLAGNKRYREILLANFLEDEDFWIGHQKDDYLDIFRDWTKRTESLSYNYEIEIRSLSSDLNTLFSSDEIPNALLRKTISIETATILNILFKYSSRLDRLLKDNFWWPSYSRRIKAYDYFLRFYINIDRLKIISKNYFD